MNINYLLHKLFLISMLVVCTVAVVLFVRQQANADDSIAATTTIKSTTATNPVTTNTTNPITTSAINPVTTSTTKQVTTSATSPVTTSTVIPTTTINAASSQTPVSSTETTATATKTQIPVVSEVTANSVVGTTATIESKTITGLNEPTVNSGEKNYNITATVEMPVVTGDNVVASQINQLQTAEQQKVTDDSLQKTAVVEKSQIIKAPVIVEAEKLVQINNPKISGLVNETLKVEKVELVENEKGNKQVALSGKSEPNAIVTIYIFSKDPIVISVKADENGVWNYELDKELADGQHEVYVAVADEAGKVISKSQPIAFVKTAQAANMIPMSEFNENKSPMERSIQQYILIAIVVMSICLIVALAAIGFLTHKQNINERNI